MGFPVEIRRRAYQRNINVRLKREGFIRVTSGRSVPQAEIYKFLESLQDWLKKVWAQYEVEETKNPVKKFVPGEEFLFLGELKNLEWIEKNSKRPRFEVIENKLVCYASFESGPLSNENFAPDKPSRSELKKAYAKFLRTQAELHFAERVDFFSKQMNLYPKKLSFRAQKSRWGSCSSNGTLSLNWQLISAPLEVIDYVIVHELAHLRHPNHSKNFWDLVEQAYPNYREARLWLKRHGHQLILR